MVNQVEIGVSANMIQIGFEIHRVLKEGLNRARLDNGASVYTSIDTSKPSEFVFAITQLKSESADRFRSVMKKISDIAKNSCLELDDGSFESVALMKLSDKFSSMAESGEISYSAILV